MTTKFLEHSALAITARFVPSIRTMVTAYPIGSPGQAWGPTEKSKWLETRTIQRSYDKEVVTTIHTLKDRFDVHQYGALSQDPARYPLYAVQSRNWNPNKLCVLITGGVHGYETSGVQGALLFLETKAEAYTENFNILVIPCVSPWGYETIQRWNAQAVDPNRSFNPDGEVVEGRSFNPEAATEESGALMQYLRQTLSPNSPPQWICHLDLHETTDTDETEFWPAKAARDGAIRTPGMIPDGFYLVSDQTNPQTAWHKAMIDAVRTVTHIAPADEHGKIIGEEVSQEGVVQIPPPKSLGLCSGVTDAPYATTTEVYPDSPQATGEQCNQAQVACIEGALKYLMEHETEKFASK